MIFLPLARCQTCEKWRHLSDNCAANPKSITILKRGDTESSLNTPTIEHAMLQEKTQENNNGVCSSLIQTPVVDVLLEVTEIEPTKNQTEAEKDKSDEEAVWTEVSPNNVGRQVEIR